MPRPPSVRWCDRREAWISSVGQISETNGRRLPVAFRAGTDGKPIGKKDKAKAQRALDAYVEERDSRVITGNDPTIGNLIQLYLQHSEATAAYLTYRGHAKILRLVEKFEHGGRAYSDIIARELTVADIERMVRKWIALERKPNYISRLVASVQAMLNWATEPAVDRNPERLIAVNPIAGYRPRLEVEEKPERFAERAEIAAFLRYAWREASQFNRKSPLRRFGRLTVLLVRTIAVTGCRPGEGCAIEWSDINWETGIVTFPTNRHKTGRKKRKPRKILLTRSIRRALRREFDRPDRHPRFAFMHRHGSRAGKGRDEIGSPWNSNTLSRWVKAVRRRAIAAKVKGVQDEGENRFHNYRLRHSHISEWSMKGVDQGINAELHGTSKAMLDKTYEHIQERFLRQTQEEADRKR